MFTLQLVNFRICQGFFFVKFVLFFILIRYILGISLFYFFGGVFMVADTVRVNFMMSKENLKRVDEACVRWGVNRTAFINFACMNFLRQEELY